MRKLLILIVLIAALGQGCETDFEVNAPWRDVTIVYGLLDQSESRHFIRINKAFLGEVDVNTMAQIRDSSEYDPADIEVTIEERNEEGVVQNVWTLQSMTDTMKVGGTFYAPDQTLYYFDNALDSSKLYKLVISNKVSGKVVSATTPIIEDFSFQFGTFWANPQSRKVNFYKDGSYQTFNKAAWYTPKNGKRYQLTLRFHYREVDLGNPGSDTLNLYIDWIFAAITSSNLNAGEEMGVEINGEDFYQFVANNLTPSSPSNFVERYIGELDFIVDVAGEDLHTYIEVNAPSTGIVQERPEYSNVFDGNGNSGIGIFSCRHTVTKANATLSTSGVTSNSKTELCSGQYTWELGFVNPGTCN
ncbi:MAG TPA: DUF4249 family protein [Flavobacteriales bacterium]|nr:DUF4249 family protein [Flavobacteriales bacterium]